jgi:hypothetical protein
MRRVALAAALGFALVGPVLFRPIWESDAGWHLAVGRLAIEQGIPRTNALSWTAPDNPWYATSWLFDVLAASLEARLGELGLQLLCAALLLIALALWALSLRQIDPQLGPLLLPAGAALLIGRVTHRPHLATWAALAAVLLLCLRGRGRSTAHRWACAAVIALAGNLHAGAGFAAGVAGLFCIEELWRTRRAEEALAAAACGLALLANPGALYNVRYLLENLRVHEVISLVENLPASPRDQPLFFALALAGVAAGIFTLRERGFALLGSFLAMAALSLRSQRVVYDAALPLLPLLAAGLSRLRGRIGLPAASALAVALCLLCVAGSRLDRWVRTMRLEAAWNADRVPVRAAGFVATAGLEGRRFNGLADGGFLEHALRGQRSFADGRIQAYPPSFWRAFSEAERSPRAFRAWLVSLGVEWALCTRTRERLGGYRLLDDPAWALVYWDTLSEVWIRRDVLRLRPLVDRYEYRRFRPYGAIVGTIARLSRGELLEYAEEVSRYEGTSPTDPFVPLVRCALAVRSASADAAARCAEAERAGSEAVAALVPRARAVPPLPP